jgi:hypothetical protein
MKALAHLSFALGVVAVLGCTTQPAVKPSAPTPLTRLDGDQVNALIPYMVDRKKDGELQSSFTEAPDKRVVVHYQRQAFTFELWIDANGHPTMPPKDDGSTTSMRRATQHHGSFTVGCQSICEWPAPNANISCAMSGCVPISDNTCGCTPPDCGNCVSLGCGSFVDGFLAGNLVMM